VSSIQDLTLDAHGLFTDLPGAIATFEDGRIDVVNPSTEDIRIGDIARSLSNKCRWNGMCPFYSVAEHSVAVSLMVPTLEALLHDASEAYLNDMARPIKMKTDLGAAYMPYEENLERVIAEAFNLTWPWPKEVKQADYACGFAEAKVLVPHLGRLMPTPDVETPPIVGYTPDQAMALFLIRYEELVGPISA
jgi:hypothetical protein